jgi:site-specific DNA-adenine methylase
MKTDFLRDGGRSGKMKDGRKRDFERLGDRWIIAHFPRRYKEMLYVEPFFGEGTVFWNKEPSAAEFVNDRSGVIAGLYGRLALSGRNRVWVLNTGPKDMLRLAGGKDVFIYIDPPAQVRKNGELRPGAMSDDEHEELLKLANETGAAVLVSARETDLYRERLGYWDQDCFPAAYGKRRRRGECLWANYSIPRIDPFAGDRGLC